MLREGKQQLAAAAKGRPPPRLPAALRADSRIPPIPALVADTTCAVRAEWELPPSLEWPPPYTGGLFEMTASGLGPEGSFRGEILPGLQSDATCYIETSGRRTKRCTATVLRTANQQFVNIGHAAYVKVRLRETARSVAQPATLCRARRAPPPRASLRARRARPSSLTWGAPTGQPARKGQLAGALEPPPSFVSLCA